MYKKFMIFRCLTSFHEIAALFDKNQMSSVEYISITDIETKESKLYDSLLIKYRKLQDKSGVEYINNYPEKQYKHINEGEVVDEEIELLYFREYKIILFISNVLNINLLRKIIPIYDYKKNNEVMLPIDIPNEYFKKLLKENNLSFKEITYFQDARLENINASKMEITFKLRDGFLKNINDLGIDLYEAQITEVKFEYYGVLIKLNSKGRVLLNKWVDEYALKKIVDYLAEGLEEI
ncbi:hypothetical protein [Paenibacillus tundrae]|uniref:hypothetical protein n=1 Tax=Paenibacillus tundrae TaxID=528187 RepID=UPI0030D4AD06